MSGFGPEQAFAAYEAARHRLPGGGSAGAGESITTLEDIADRFDAFLLDAFGVLNIGERAIPGVPERIAALQAAGKRMLVLTNAASYPLDALAAKYRRLGYDLGPDDIVSSRLALLAEMAGQPDLHWGVVLAPDLGADDLSGLRFSLLADDPGVYRSVDAFMLLSSKDWTSARQELLEAALLDRPRSVWVGNPDIVAPREDGFSIEPGYFAHRLADRTGIAPWFFGKPFANIYDLALDRLGDAADRSRIVMVGDSLHTDILGAQNAGIAAALVTGYGFFAGQDAAKAIARSEIQPDFLLERP